MIVTKTITAENQWTDPITIPHAGAGLGKGTYSFSIQPVSSPVMTITFQKRYKGETTWRHADAWDIIASHPGYEFISDHPEPEEGVQYRAGCATGDFTSGSCALRIGVL